MIILSDVQSLMDDIRQWDDKTFGAERKVSPVLHHLQKEVQEVIDAVHCEIWSSSLDTTDQEEEVKIEFADCLILLLNAASKYGMSFSELLSKAESKMEINKLREWGEPDEHGVVEHIRN